MGLFIALFAGGHKPPMVTLRVNIQTAGQGLSEQLALPIALPKTGETILIRSTAEVSEKNLRNIELRPDGSTVLTFDHQGRINLSTATGTNQGRYMVISIDGVVMYAPLIDIQIDDGVLILPHPLPPGVFQLLLKVAQDNSKEYHDSVVQ